MSIALTSTEFRLSTLFFVEIREEEVCECEFANLYAGKELP
jgi:hypothetical protein